MPKMYSSICLSWHTSELLQKFADRKVCITVQRFLKFNRMFSPAVVVTFFELLLSHYILDIKCYDNSWCHFHTCKKVTAYTRFLKHVKKPLFSIYSQLSLDNIRPNEVCLQFNWNVWLANQDPGCKIATITSELGSVCICICCSTI